MKTISKSIGFPLDTSKQINVIITKKHMKNMRLSISKSGNVMVSIPYSTTYSYAYQFLVRKREWIANQLNKISKNVIKDSCNFKNQGNIFLLGNNYPLIIKLGTKNNVIFNNCNNQTSPISSLNQNNYGFVITIKNQNEDIKKIFIRWCKNYFLDFFTNRLNYIYSQMFKTSNPPSIKIKTMKSMWGNCNFVKKIITLNLYLAKTPIECIDYVIIHELAHLVHHNHSKQFHALMTTILPDWKTRKKMLNNYTLAF
ncbi:MAG: M48 family metallopeptidase [Clostridia bacterium]|nr:M48 family metallopeptidase [Clostridia bacterium]